MSIKIKDFIYCFDDDVSSLLCFDVGTSQKIFLNFTCRFAQTWIQEFIDEENFVFHKFIFAFKELSQEFMVHFFRVESSKD